MKLNYYSFFYFNILLIIFLLINNIFLFIIILIMKGVFYVNLESDSEYEFNFLNLDFERFDAKFLEIDIDDQYIYTLLNQENYLSFNCRFFFDFYGGSDTLDFIDFIDFTIYKINDNRNFKNIFIVNNGIINTYNEDYIYKMSDIINKMYIDNYYFNLAENDNKQYNIVYNIDLKNNIKNKQIYKIKKIWIK
jgi:hypothetical protein